ncbi:MAG: spermidine synthase, partial [Comamonadaceae bacterium]
SFAMRALQRSEPGYILFNLTSITMAAAVMLPATICAGMTLPLITTLLLRRGFGERQVGQVYGVNTFGAIAGVLLAVHVLIPMLGLKWSLAAGAAIDVVLGLLIWRGVTRAQPAPQRGWMRPRWALGAVAATSAALLVGLTLVAPLEADRFASGVFRHGLARIDQSKVLFHRDGKTATVTVLEVGNGLRSLLTNGKSDGATHPQGKVVAADDHTMVLLGALGPAHHPQAKRAAVVGLGTGTTTAVLLGAPGLEHVDTIEIEPMMVEAAQLFRPRTSAVYEDPRSHIVIDDARAHFSKSRSLYDIVISEPSNPWVSGVAGLFTVEFYQHVSDHLAPDGHFVQWLHLYEAGPELAGSIIRAFSTVFPEFRAYATNDSDIALVARH